MKPQKGEFVKVGKMSIPRYRHKAVLLDDGRVLIIGGITRHERGDGPTKSAEVYNPKTKKFTTVGSMNELRDEFTATKLNNGKVLIAGGQSRTISVKSTELYNPQTNKFEKGPDMNFYRSDHTATLLKDGRVLLSGGEYSVFALNNKNIPDEIYNPRTGKFSIAASLNVPRHNHSSILLQDGRVLILGGSNKKGILSSIEIYNTKNNKFKLDGNMNLPRVKPNVYVLKNGNVIISGGVGKGNGNAIFLREIEIYNPKTNKFKILTKRNSIPQMPAEVLLKDDRILFTGGATGVGLSVQYYKTSETYNTATNKFTEGKNMNRVREGHVAILLKDGNVLITGSSGPQNSRITELYINK